MPLNISFLMHLDGRTHYKTRLHYTVDQIGTMQYSKASASSSCKLKHGQRRIEINIEMPIRPEMSQVIQGRNIADRKRRRSLLCAGEGISVSTLNAGRLLLRG